MSLQFPSTSERDFTRQIRELATLFHWRRYHTWLAKHSPAGFPDEVLVRPPRLILAELKTEQGKLSPSQIEWLDDLAAIPTVEVYVWRPSMFDEIANCLQAAGKPTAQPGAWQPLDRGTIEL